MTLYSKDSLADLAASLLAAPDSPARASVIARAVVQLIPDSAFIVHRMMSDRPSSPWVAIGKAGDISVRQVSQSTPSRLLAPLLSQPPQAPIYLASDIRREDYAHLNVSRSIASLAYLPLLHKEQIVAAIDLLTFSSATRRQYLAQLPPI